MADRSFDSRGSEESFEFDKQIDESADIIVPSTPPNKTNSPHSQRIPRGDLGIDPGASLRTQTVTEEGTMIWGTKIKIEEQMRVFKAFLSSYELHVEKEKKAGRTRASAFEDKLVKRNKYMEMIEDLHISKETALTIDCEDLYEFDKSLYQQLVMYPQEIIPMMDVVVNNLYDEHKIPSQDPSQIDLVSEEYVPMQQLTINSQPIQVRIRNLRETEWKAMRDLDPSQIDQLVTIKGMVTRLSEIIPDLRQAFFSCASCRNTHSSVINRGRIEEPSRCPKCGESFSMELIHNRCVFSDKQLIKLQETPETIPEGETPHTVSLCVFDALVDSVKAGDRVEVTGVYRAMQVRVDSNKRTVKTVYRNYIDVLHFSKDGVRVQEDNRINETDSQSSQRKYMDDDEDDVSVTDSQDEDDEERVLLKQQMQSLLTKEDVNKILELSRNPNIYQQLTAAVAPSIWQMEDVKKGVLLQLFGGANKTMPNYKIRGEMHVLLVGDPGVSKSQILTHIHKIAPRGIYTSGKGSSAVGLTAYVTRDPDTGEFVLESGALVLSDLGVCCIDEFDKMNDATRSILHEVMEQQTVSVAKAGIICSLNARTSVLAAANPKESRYNDFISIVENIQLPPTLLSRFDLIFLLRDIPDPNRDMQLARHIVSMHFATPKMNKAVIDTTMLTKYISYAKNKIQPKITEEAAEKLIEGYIALRRIGSHKKQITATTRQLESLVRLSEAHARMRLSEEVVEEDVDEALRLVRVSIFKAATDPKSGQVDIDLLTTGMNREQREEMQNAALDDEITPSMDDPLM